MDTSFDDMIELFQAAWPALSRIDWCHYCPGASPYDDDAVPRYTGAIMHREAVESTRYVGANTIVVGFLCRPEKSAMVVSNKTSTTACQLDRVKASIERRNPEMSIWGGGVLCSRDTTVAYAISGLPEIVDHLLVAEMMWTCGLLCLDDWRDITDFSFPGVKEACASVDIMDETGLERLKDRIRETVNEAAKSLGLST